MQNFNVAIAATIKLCIDGLYSFIVYFRNTRGVPHQKINIKHFYFLSTEWISSFCMGTRKNSNGFLHKVKWVL